MIHITTNIHGIVEICGCHILFYARVPIVQRMSVRKKQMSIKQLSKNLREGGQPGYQTKHPKSPVNPKCGFTAAPKPWCKTNFVIQNLSLGNNDRLQGIFRDPCRILLKRLQRVLHSGSVLAVQFYSWFLEDRTVH